MKNEILDIEFEPGWRYFRYNRHRTSKPHLWKARDGECWFRPYGRKAWEPSPSGLSGLIDSPYIIEITPSDTCVGNSPEFCGKHQEFHDLEEYKDTPVHIDEFRRYDQQASELASFLRQQNTTTSRILRLTYLLIVIIILIILIHSL